MGKQARKRREQRAHPDAGGTAAARPWYRHPVTFTAAVLVGVLCVGLGIWWQRRAAPPAEPSGGALDAGPAEVAEVEPNDTPERAQQLPRLPATVRGTLRAGDRDCFRFGVSEPGGFVLDAWTEGYPGARLRVLGAGGAELAAVTAPARIGALGLVRGDFVVVVEPDAAGATGAYRLVARLAPWQKGFDWEPNDTPAKAQPMAELTARKGELARHRARGSWSVANDVDCYTVPFQVPPAGAQLRFELTPPAAVAARLEVLDLGNVEAKIAPRTLAVATSPAPGRPAVLPTLGARSWEAAYTACVRAATGEDFAGHYTLDVKLETAGGGFEFEPNDTAETASALPPAVTAQGYLTTGDVDWYRVSASANRTSQLRLRTPVAAEVVLLALDKREIAKAQAPAGQLLTLKGDGVAFVRLRAIGDGNTATTYSISVSPPGESP